MAAYRFALPLLLLSPFTAGQFSVADDQPAGANAAASSAEISQPREVAAQVLAAQAERIAVMQRASQATVAIFGLDGGGGGSGVLVTPDGYALTNYHVSSACGDHMRCGLNDGRVYDAVIVGVDATGDVSLIKLLGRTDFPTAPLADSDQVRIGQWCFAAGNPFVLATNLQPSISLGIVSGVNRYQYPAGTLLEYADCIQTDAAINPGNSGGPLFNLAGEVIGINGRCSFEKRGRVNVGVGYAISANQIKYFMGMLRSGRLVDHATLGATVSTDASGTVRVSNILSNSDAYRRGLRYGDEIVRLADRDVRSTNAFKNVLGTLPKDWRVPLTIRRDGNNQTLLVRLDGVHTEKQLIDLVNAEAASGHGEPDKGRKDPPPGNHDLDEEPEEDRSEHPQDGQDATQNQTDQDGSLQNGQPNKALVESMLVSRTGFANYYFNQLRRGQIWEQLQQQADFTTAAGDWQLSGNIAGETTPVALRLGGQSGELRVGSRVLKAELTDRMSEIVSQRRETGLLVALHALRQLLQLGPERIGDTIYLGALPVYVGSSKVLADQPRQDVLQSLWYDAKVRFSFDPATQQISLIEVFGDPGQDPIELYVDQYAQIAHLSGDQGEGSAEAKKWLFPKRLRLQYGTEPLLLLAIEDLSIGGDATEAATEASTGDDGNAEAAPAKKLTTDRQTRVETPDQLRTTMQVVSGGIVSGGVSRNGQAHDRHRGDGGSNSPLPVAPPNRAQVRFIAAPIAAKPLLQTAVQAKPASHDTSRGGVIGSINSVAIATELKTVKLFGAGGVANLDAYQSGFFISPEGHVLTSWSTVLDVDTIIAVSSDGGRFESKVLGIDPNLEIAILSTGQATGNYFDLGQVIDPPVGTRVLAFSNLYGIATGSEMSSVQKGVIMARTELNARRGTFESVYQGPVFIIDAMTNNPGAAGGALTTIDGRLVGMLGKELRDASANTWLNYAIPMSQLRESVQRILSGKSIQRASTAQRTVDRPSSLKLLGIVLVPNVLPKTPAFVDLVEPQSPASIAGLQNDDLILFINSARVTSQAALIEVLKTIDRADKVALLVQRGKELREIVLSP